jgi:nucleoid-associated protein YgaU
VTLANPDIVNLNPPQDAEQNAPQNAPPNAATNATQTGPTLHRTQGNPQGETPAERIRREAIARGEDVEPVDGGNNIPAPPKKPTTPAQPQPKAVAAGYKAQSGDTLGTIALRALGANNKANREAIVAANPSLQSNRNLIVAGRVYAVPVMTNGRTPASPSSVQPVDSETVDAPARETNVTYVVQSGDTLWSIAVNELGSPSAVDTIEQLNQDILGDSEQLRPNMKLRLPTKKVATAN